MLIVNDEQRLRAGIKSLSKRCPYCSKELAVYPLILSDDAGLSVYHTACAAALATDILVDLYTFFRPPAPYHRLFVLDATQAAAPSYPAGCERKTLYVKSFWDQFESKRKIRRKERWRNDFNKA